MIEIALRLNAEDAALALGAQRLANNLSIQEQRDEAFPKYLKERFLLTLPDGQSIPWKYLGSELIKLDVWIYLEAGPVVRLYGLSITHQVLTEYDAEQNNMITAADGERRWVVACDATQPSVVLGDDNTLGEDAAPGHEPTPDPAEQASPPTNTNSDAASQGTYRPSENTAVSQMAQGRVFHDQSGDGVYNDGEPLLPGIRVSNGREIVRTDVRGAFSLPVDDDDAIFVIKPRGWRTAIDALNLPRFYYLHKPLGSPALHFPGVAPTGPLPASIDFPLYPQDEPNRFEVLLFGDTQPRDEKEMDFLLHDVIEECIDTSAAFGVTLGDIVFDDLRVFDSYTRGVALVGIPWYNVLGNHDINYDAKSDEHSDETFERYFGPSYYAFDYGPTHFIVLDDVEWQVTRGANGEDKGEYRGGLGGRQMEFIRRDLAEIPAGQMVVLMMHIPLVDVHDRQELYRLIENRPLSLSISAHRHYHRHVYIDETDGWRGPVRHHHVINVTACGSWWSGAKDERGIPHTLMRCGAPNGYTTLAFDGADYRLRFKAAAFSADYQMIIHAPETTKADDQTEILANVFNALPDAAVEFRIGEKGPWIPMQPAFNRVDPAFQRLADEEKKLGKIDWISLPKTEMSGHLWSGNLPAGIATGTHLLHVRARDPVNGEVHGKRGIRVVVDP